MSSSFETVNIARGLCLILMLLAHTLSTSEGGDTWLTLFHMPGWSTTNFVMLSGFALALFAGKRTPEARKARARKRGWQLLIIAYLSNIIFASFREVVHGALTLSALVNILLSKEQWTISAILLPSAALVFLSPYLEVAVERLGALSFLLLVSVVELMGWLALSVLSGGTPHSLWFAALFDFDNASFVFPLALLFGLGVWAYSLGAQFRSVQRFQLLFLALLALISYLLIQPSAIPLLYVYRFSATLAAALVIALIPWTTPVGRFTALLGRSSLLVFILHRALLQMQRVSFAKVPATTRTPLMFFVTLAICLAVCQWREHSEKVGVFLKRGGF